MAEVLLRHPSLFLTRIVMWYIIPLIKTIARRWEIGIKPNDKIHFWKVSNPNKHGTTQFGCHYQCYKCNVDIMDRIMGGISKSIEQ